MGTVHRIGTPAGPLSVTLPDGAELQDAGGIAYWSPEPRLGRFTVAPTPGLDAEALLAAERERGDLDVEADEAGDRGGVPVRRLRYRVRVRSDREVRLTPQGERHEGGTQEEHLADTMLIGTGAQTARAGYAVRADAPDDVRAGLAAALEGIRIGTEA